MTIDQQLVEPQICKTNPELAELQRRAIRIAKYYHKGFGGLNGLDGILSLSEAYLLLSDKKERRKEGAYEILHDIEQIYSSIPFAELEGQPEFEPLFKVRPLIVVLRGTMDRFFDDPKREHFENLKMLLKQIAEEGRPYFKTLLDLTTKIRTFPEASDFRVNIPDKYSGYVYRW